MAYNCIHSNEEIHYTDEEKGRGGEGSGGRGGWWTEGVGAKSCKHGAKLTCDQASFFIVTSKPDKVKSTDHIM